VCVVALLLPEWKNWIWKKTNAPDSLFVWSLVQVSQRMATHFFASTTCPTSCHFLLFKKHGWESSAKLEAKFRVARWCISNQKSQLG
jgi:hypothetical protein